jgi:hypothetical protein
MSRPAAASPCAACDAAAGGGRGGLSAGRSRHAPPGKSPDTQPEQAGFNPSRQPSRARSTRCRHHARAGRVPWITWPVSAFTSCSDAQGRVVDRPRTAQVVALRVSAADGPMIRAQRQAPRGGMWGKPPARVGPAGFNEPAPWWQCAVPPTSCR